MRLVLTFAVALPYAVAQSYVGFEFEPAGEPTAHYVSEGVAKPYTVFSQVYYSQGFPLKPGQMLFSDMSKTQVPMPGNHTRRYAFTGVAGDIVKDVKGVGKVAAPLSEVYDHHWIVSDLHHENRICPYGPNYVFGIGAESRNSPVHVPKGHGYFVNRGDYWGANIHLLRTDAGKYLKGDNPHEAVQQCNECWYGPNKGAGCSPNKNGTFQCCGERCYDGTCACPTTPAAKFIPATTYYLRYEVNYTYDTDALIPIKSGVFTTPNCQTFYEVFRNDEHPETVSSSTFKMPVDVELILAIGHQHVGARNISLFHNDKLLCTSYPRYGSEEGVAGNEKGYLVQMSECWNADGNKGKGYMMRAGDTLRLDSWYWVGSNDPVLAPNPGGTHLNVMGYMYMLYKTQDKEWPHPPNGRTPSVHCQQVLHRYCGHLVGFTDQCLDCVSENEAKFADAACGLDVAQAACTFMGPRGGMLDSQKRRIVPDDVVV